MKLHLLLLISTLALLIVGCHGDGLNPGQDKFLLLIRPCQAASGTWPRDLSVDVYYFAPETNMDDAYERVTRERYPPAETVELKATDADQTGSFTLKLKPDRVVVLLFHTPGSTKIAADAQLGTTHSRSGELCI
jgi:hypothetical protein